MRVQCAPTLDIVLRSKKSTRGVLRLADAYLPCAIGRSGLTVKKREGDLATPAGAWSVRFVLYRPDKVRRPQTYLPVYATGFSDGWCDATGDRNYNRPVEIPYRRSAEALWRPDSIYDIVAVLNHNTVPRRQNGGSAIFMHIARDDYRPTEGCIALARDDLLAVLARCGPATLIRVGISGGGAG